MLKLYIIFIIISFLMLRLFIVLISEAFICLASTSSAITDDDEEEASSYQARLQGCGQSPRVQVVLLGQNAGKAWFPYDRFAIVAITWKPLLRSLRLQVRKSQVDHETVFVKPINLHLANVRILAHM